MQHENSLVTKAASICWYVNCITSYMKPYKLKWCDKYIRIPLVLRREKNSYIDRLKERKWESKRDMETEWHGKRVREIKRETEEKVWAVDVIKCIEKTNCTAIYNIYACTMYNVHYKYGCRMLIAQITHSCTFTTPLIVHVHTRVH